MDLLKKHVLFLKHNDNSSLPNINIKFADKYKSVDFQKKIFNLICVYKDQIENNYDKWNYTKKLTNNFEMISSSNNNFIIGVARFKPISRAYFKLWEIIKDLDLIDFNKKKIVIVGLAEGPGGFIQCIYNMRKIYTKNNEDKFVCITLIDKEKTTPGWKKSHKLFQHNPSINIYYGPSKDGDLYKRNNIEGLSNYVNNDKADIVTADGGFDFSSDYKNQEQLSYKLIFCEVVSAIATLKIGGNFILKIFDIFTNFNIKLIYFLTTLFIDGVYIMKPFTSRPSNSEKYIVCKKFKGIEQTYLNKLYTIIDDWDKLTKNNKFVYDIFDINVPDKFEKSIQSYNIYIVTNQLKNILKTLSYIKLNLNYRSLDVLKQEQSIISLLWCKKYNIDININSRYLNKKLNNLINI